MTAAVSKPAGSNVDKAGLACFLLQNLPKELVAARQDAEYQRAMSQMEVERLKVHIVGLEKRLRSSASESAAKDMQLKKTQHLAAKAAEVVAKEVSAAKVMAMEQQMRAENAFEQAAQQREQAELDLRTEVDKTRLAAAEETSRLLADAATRAEEELEGVKQRAEAD